MRAISFPSSTVIFEGSNDKLAAQYLAERNPQIPAGHSGTSVVPIDDHRIKIYQKLPEKVYNAAAEMSEEDQKRRQEIIDRLPTARDSEEKFAHKVKGDKEEIGIFAKIAAKALAQDRQAKALKSTDGNKDLYGRHFSDKRTHTLHHFTMEATPGNEVTGRDHSLVHRLMADMLTREDPKDVAGYFRRQEERARNDVRSISGSSQNDGRV